MEKNKIENKKPQKEIVEREETIEKPQKDLDPTRYGDWEKGGRCIDF